MRGMSVANRGWPIPAYPAKKPFGGCCASAGKACRRVRCWAAAAPCAMKRWACAIPNAPTPMWMPSGRKASLNAVTATMNGYFLHNICWYSDPDYCLLRLPLDLRNGAGVGDALRPDRADAVFCQPHARPGAGTHHADDEDPAGGGYPPVRSLFRRQQQAYLWI